MALIIRNLGSHKYERTISGCWSRWHVQELRCRVSRCWYRLPHTVLTWVSWVLEVLTSSMCMAYHTSRDQYTVFLFFMRIRVWILAMCHAPSPRKYVGFVEGGRDGSGFFDLFYRGIAPHLHIGPHRRESFHIALPLTSCFSSPRRESKIVDGKSWEINEIYNWMDKLEQLHSAPYFGRAKWWRYLEGEGGIWRIVNMSVKGKSSRALPFALLLEFPFIVIPWSCDETRGRPRGFIDTMKNVLTRLLPKGEDRSMLGRKAYAGTRGY